MARIACGGLHQQYSWAEIVEHDLLGVGSVLQNKNLIRNIHTALFTSFVPTPDADVSGTQSSWRCLEAPKAIPEIFCHRFFPIENRSGPH